MSDTFQDEVPETTEPSEVPIGEFEGMPVVGGTISFTRPMQVARQFPHGRDVYLLVEATVTEVNFPRNGSGETVRRAQRCLPQRALVLDGEAELAAIAHLQAADPQQSIDFDGSIEQ